MSVFTITDKNNNPWFLSVTTDIKIDRSSNITSHPVVRGESVVDNVVNSNVSITFNGLVTDLQTTQFEARPLTDGELDIQGQQEVSYKVKDFISNIERIRQSKEFVTISYDNQFNPFQNCIIKNFSISKNSGLTLGYNVNLQFEQVRLSEVSSVAVVIVPREDQTNPDLNQAGSNSSGSNTESSKESFTGLAGGVVTTKEVIADLAAGGT